jgi:hypothetical protein
VDAVTALLDDPVQLFNPRLSAVIELPGRARDDAALIETRHWPTNVSPRQLLGERDLLNRYAQFRKDLPTLATQLNLDPDPAKITYMDLEMILVGWLESRPIRVN